MKDTLVAFVLVVVAFITGMAIGLQKSPRLEEPTPGRLIAPGTAIFAGDVQASWLRHGVEKGDTRVWVNVANDPANVIELVVTGKSIRVVKDGTPIGVGVKP